MNPGTYILGVDDEPTNRMILEEIFEEDDVEFKCVTNGSECLELVKNREPNLILLDVNMPELNGLETCKILRETHRDIPILFVSALATPEERLAGYEAGGDDYITKPFNEEELKAKVNLALAQYSDKSRLRDEKSVAMQTTMIAISSASELGLIVHFLQESFSCPDAKSLALKALEHIDQYGVSVSLIIKDGNEKIVVFNDGIERPLELEVLEQLESKGRIYHAGKVTVFNGKVATMLLRNVPDDEEKAGRLRDHLIVLLDGIDARLSAISTEQELDRKQLALANALKVAQNEIQKIESIHRSQQNGVVNGFSTIGQHIEKALLTLELTEEQEHSLKSIVDVTETNTRKMYQQGNELELRYRNLVSQLSSVL
ncbi:MAG: response regulator [Gammaproteobacteria bacterium]|nr:response regulator [Gammaproteobacteria bacterium]MDH5801801.1 response regulator [Gammaproteobacteria bacterium]